LSVIMRFQLFRAAPALALLLVVAPLARAEGPAPAAPATPPPATTSEKAAAESALAALHQENSQLATARAKADATVEAQGLEIAALKQKLAAPPAAEPQDSTDAKLAVVLRSYTLLQAETDQLKAAQEKLLAEKSALEAQLAVAKNALPLADQAVALHEQLRQTQDQLAALSLENNQLKTRLSLGSASQGSVMPAPTAPGGAASALTPVTVNPPAARTHVIATGDTLSRISVQYYGTPGRWTEILAANRDVLRDEKSLVVGRTLRIP
jgi:nucleoid-associated protein YgaU